MMPSRTKYTQLIRAIVGVLPFLPIIVVAAFFLYPRLDEFFGDSLVDTPLHSNRILALRFPPVDEGRWVIILYNDDPAAFPRLAIRGLENRFKEEMREKEVSQEAWTSMNTLRASWCQDTPSFQKVAKNALYYEVAFRCRDIFGVYAKRVIIPFEQVPLELQQLILLFE